MKKNIGTLDRTFRIGVGLALLSLVFIGPQTLWGLLGLIPLITGLSRFCPAYSATGIDSCGGRVS